MRLIDLLTIADRFSIGRAEEIIQQVNEAVARWPQFAREAGIASEEIERIGRTIVWSGSAIMDSTVWSGSDLTRERLKI